MYIIMYKNKYLKYKEKYLTLKQLMIGGSDEVVEIPDNIYFTKNKKYNNEIFSIKLGNYIIDMFIICSFKYCL